MSIDGYDDNAKIV